MILTRSHVKGDCLHSVALWLSVCDDATMPCTVLDVPRQCCVEVSGVKQGGGSIKSQEKGVKSYFVW